MLKRLIPCLALGLSLAMGLAQLAQAEPSALRRLDTADDSQGWNAVGRLEIDGRGFCTAALIADNLVLTAAHCLYDPQRGTRFDPSKIEFRADFRNGRAAAYRQIRRAVVPPDYNYNGKATPDRIRNDIALLELYQPIRNTRITPFETAPGPARGSEVAVVSYAEDRPNAPSLQEICGLIARQEGVMILSCSVDYGSSGAPVFSLSNGKPRIISVVSAKTEVDNEPMALGSDLQQSLATLYAQLSSGAGHGLPPAPRTNRINAGVRGSTGAKFVRPGN